jgi:holo-[acyl-carrier protein] synthase
VDVDEVRDAMLRHGERYLQRVYTRHELGDCGGRPRALAARFAAKEATIKVLGAHPAAPAWTSIGVRRGEGGDRLELTGPAQALAERRAVRSLWVSLSARRRNALAIVVAEFCDD